MFIINQSHPQHSNPYKLCAIRSLPTAIQTAARGIMEGLILSNFDSSFTA